MSEPTAAWALLPEPAGEVQPVVREAYQELLSAGSQDLSVQQLPGLLAQIVQHVGEDEAALRIVAHFHAVLVANRQFMQRAMAMAQGMEALLQDAERRVQQLEHIVALLKDAPTPRGTLAAFADQLRAFVANALARLYAVRFHEDDEERRLTVAVALITFITAVKILHRRLLAKMG